MVWYGQLATRKRPLAFVERSSRIDWSTGVTLTAGGEADIMQKSGPYVRAFTQFDVQPGPVALRRGGGNRDGMSANGLRKRQALAFVLFRYRPSTYPFYRTLFKISTVQG